MPRQALALPPALTLERMAGFGVFMLEAVLSGRGDGLVDLARVNLFRRVPSLTMPPGGAIVRPPA